MKEFNEVAEDLGLMDTMEALRIDCHGHDDDDNDTHTHDYHMDDDVKDGTNCSLVFDVCQDLILRARLTTRACLAGNVSSLDDSHDDKDGDEDDEVSDGEGQ